MLQLYKLVIDSVVLDKGL